MAVPEYVKPIQLTKATQDWISKMNGAIQHARNHPDTNQRGYNPEFWQRLKAKDIKSIPSGQYQASHKMGYAEADGKYYVYPSIQEIDGKLVDLSDNDELAFKTALKNNNFIVAPSEEIAENFSKYYKQSKTFPGFQKFNPISNIRYNNIVMNNKQRVFSLYNKFIKEGYSPEQAAGIIGNLVIEGELNENSKETNGKGEGLAQWTTEARKQAMRAHPRVLFDSEFDAQSDFLTKELQDKNVWTRARVNKIGFEQQRIPYKNPSAKVATTYFMKGYENPKSSASHEKDRQEVANYIMSPEFQTEYQAQLLYKKEGGEMNYINYYKLGSGIHIKKANKGKFTDYCGGKVTSECIARGKRSSSAAVRKRATFAANARKWKHEDGGILKAAWGDSVVRSIAKFRERLKKLFAKESDFEEIKNPFEQEQVIQQTSSIPGTLTWDDLNAAFTFSQSPAKTTASTSSASIKTRPRGYRNYNPLNIRISSTPWDGKVSDNTDGAFEQFTDMAHGFRAGLINMQTQIRRGKNTLRSLIATWAPDSDGNNSTSYAKHVSEATRIGLDDIIDPNNKEQMTKIAHVMAKIENGVDANIDDVIAGWNLIV